MDKNKILDKYKINSPYILFVGTIQPRKNINRLIEAFKVILERSQVLTWRSDRISNKGILSSSFAGLQDDKNKKMNAGLQDDKRSKNIKLIIIGKPGWMYEDILETPKKLGIEKDVLFLQAVTDEELPEFYKNAELFILPSLYEGFGLPILEAMNHGCPVITSKISSMPEAGGEAALYVNPNDTTDITEKMEKLLTDEKLRKEMVKKGFEQVKKFSWEKTARETLKVIEQITNN